MRLSLKTARARVQPSGRALIQHTKTHAQKTEQKHQKDSDIYISHHLQKLTQNNFITKINKFVEKRTQTSLGPGVT